MTPYNKEGDLRKRRPPNQKERESKGDRAGGRQLKGNMLIFILKGGHRWWIRKKSPSREKWTADQGTVLQVKGKARGLWTLEIVPEV